MLFLSQWRMSLISFVSGAGVYYAIGYRSAVTFIKERFKRIFVPLLFGMLLVVPPQVYLERLTQGSTQRYTAFYATIFDFVPYTDGNLSWHHLWYVAYIYTYSILLLPLLKYLRHIAALFEGVRGWLLLLFHALLLRSAALCALRSNKRTDKRLGKPLSVWQHFPFGLCHSAECRASGKDQEHALVQLRVGCFFLRVCSTSSYSHNRRKPRPVPPAQILQPLGLDHGHTWFCAAAPEHYVCLPKAGKWDGGPFLHPAPICYRDHRLFSDGNVLVHRL